MKSLLQIRRTISEYDVGGAVERIGADEIGDPELQVLWRKAEKALEAIDECLTSEFQRAKEAKGE